MSKKLHYFLIVMFTLLFSASQLYAQNTLPKVTLNLKDVKADQFFSALEKQTGYTVLFRKDLIDATKTTSILCKNKPLTELLNETIVKYGLEYKIVNKTIVITPKPKPSNKLISFRGIVLGKSDKKPVVGATVIIPGTSKGAITDEKGAFSISANEGAILEISYTGMKPNQISIISSPKPINIFMDLDAMEVEEVVVTGIFNKAKESYTGAATFISKKELKDFGSNNLIRTIGNIDPSFNIMENNKFGSDPNVLPEINIRGTTSVPTDIKDVKSNERANLNTPLFILDGFEITLERMMDLDEEEIESVTILKDASSTAIYGSRGANGVVVLTSIKPKEGKLRVSVRFNLNLEIPDLSSYNLLNAREKLELEKAADYYTDKNGFIEGQMQLDKVYSEKLGYVLAGVDTYWLSQPLRTSNSQTYGVGISGGDAGFRYSMNFSYDQNIGVMRGSSRDNLNGSINISYLYKNFQFTNTASIGLNNSTNSQYGSFGSYALLNPYWRPYDENGNPIQSFGDSVVGTNIVNPLYDATLTGYDISEYTNFMDNLSIEWSPIQSLKIGARGSYSKQISASDIFKPSTHSKFMSNSDIMTKGSYDYSTTTAESYEMSATVSFAKIIGKHNLFAGFNGSVRESSSTSYGMGTTGFTHDRLDFITMGAQYSGTNPSGNENTSRSIGATLNINYNYANTLYVDASYRTDGASSFGDQNRFKSFYSFGAGWTVSNMKFFKENLKQINTFRIRYNYGVSGSLQATNPYDALTTYQYNIKDRYEGNLAAIIMGYGNPSLSWQRTFSHNLGADISLFNGLISLDGNIYRKKTEGVVTKAALQLSHGYDNYTENKGDVLNKGYDFNISARIIRTQEIHWSVRAGFAYNKNILLKLSEEMKKISADAEEAGLTDPNFLYREGESMDALYVIPSYGIDPATGREIFMQRDGSVSYTPDKKNRVPYGVTQPKLNGRFSTSIRYKNFNATANFALRLGGQKYNGTLIQKVENADIKKNVDRRVYDNRWRGPGEYAQYKGLTAPTNSEQSSRFVQNESTLQFNSLTIGYSTSSQWLKQKLYISSLSLNARINDIFYISTVKQERGTDYPFSIKPTFTLSLTF